MTRSEDRNWTIGCFAVVILVLVGVYFKDGSGFDNPRSDYAKSCMDRKPQQFSSRNPDAEMTDDQIREIAVTCTSESEQFNFSN